MWNNVNLCAHDKRVSWFLGERVQKAAIFRIILQLEVAFYPKFIDETTSLNMLIVH